jgi:hypothetical protein
MDTELRTAIDVTADVRERLPEPLQELLPGVDCVLRRSVRFVRDDRLGEVAGGAARPDGLVRLAARSLTNLSVIGEEIMHLHRWTQGFPAIEPTVVAVAEGDAGGLRCLAGHFDEHAFFPFLEALGLHRRGKSAPLLEQTAHLLRGLLGDIEADGPTPRWRVILSVIDPHAELLPPQDEARTAVLGPFKEGPFP